ncbi:MAG: CPBP family intramembrane metalloprotease [Duncaniella sp.]|nr:CPBP family intramembrane metalloprotease [Duncaniella sp.]
MNGLKYSFGVRIVWFLLFTLVGLIIAMIAMGVILGNGVSSATLRLSTVVQDVTLFIFPAIAVAVIASSKPWSLLCVAEFPSATKWLIAFAAYLFFIPAMNAVVQWNESLSLPDSLAAVEQWMRQAEEQAQTQVEIMLGGKGLGNLIMNVLIVGVLAGLSEELYFRGALQRLISSGRRMSPHVAIWLTAFLFSLFHMQFFGFVPRMLLGALFGYTLYLTGSLWIPVAFHIFNNSAVVLSTWWGNGASGTSSIDRFGSDCWWMIVLSVILTAGSLLFLKYVTLYRKSVTG